MGASFGREWVHCRTRKLIQIFRLMNNPQMSAGSSSIMDSGTLI